MASTATSALNAVAPGSSGHALLLCQARSSGWLNGQSLHLSTCPEIRGHLCADYYGKNPKELRAEFKKSLQVILAVCREKGIEPRRSYSGKFNLRIPAELHEKLAIVAQAEGKSLNTLAQDALLQRVAA